MTFFLECLVKDLSMPILAQNSVPIADSAIRSDFKMLHPLSRGDDDGIADGLVRYVLDHVVGSTYQGSRNFAFDGIRFAAIFRKYLLHAGHMDFRLLQVRLECLLQLSVGSLRDHFGQRFSNLLFA